ncbi:glycerol acyltransferase [Prolixibacteraceae bacterium JC049]|nr:glycerol acyltransferase [Prolixibacteraceae bacterium JC049]
MEQKENTFKPLNIKEIIAEKNQKLAKRIPNFIYNYLTRILHLEDINEVMRKHGHLKGADFVNQIVEEFNIEFDLKGVENIPNDRSLIFASNHPLGGFDGMLLIAIVSKLTDRPVKFLVNDFLMHIPTLKDNFIPINKVGGQARDSLLKIEQAYASDAHILIFPAGLCSRKIKGKITDLEWNKHFIQKSAQYQRDIIPIHFSGRNSNFFYNLARFRKFIGLKKINLEMMYLADEMFKHINKKFTISFGSLVSHKEFNNKSEYKNWALKVRNMCYALNKK